MPTILGGRMPSVVHSWRDVMPGLWVMSESTEKSTGRRPHGAMRCRNTSITATRRGASGGTGRLLLRTLAVVAETETARQMQREFQLQAILVR